MCASTELICQKRAYSCGSTKRNNTKKNSIRIQIEQNVSMFITVSTGKYSRARVFNTCEYQFDIHTHATEESKKEEGKKLEK